MTDLRKEMEETWAGMDMEYLAALDGWFDSGLSSEEVVERIKFMRPGIEDPVNEERKRREAKLRGSEFIKEFNEAEDRAEELRARFRVVE